MKFIFFIVLPFLFLSSVSAKNKIVYMEPCDGAKLINVENNIIIGFENELALKKQEIIDCIKVVGSISHQHRVSIITTPDKKRIIITPETNFLPGEKVYITITGKLLQTFSYEKVFHYCFETSYIRPEWNPMLNIENETGAGNSIYENPIFDQPPVLPTLTVTVNNNPENGFIFLTNFRRDAVPYTPYLIITDKNGVIYSYSQLPTNGFDFKKQPNGNLTYFSVGKGKFYELGQSFNLLDSFYCGNGYRTDEHELRVLSNRHALLMSYDLQTVNMSLIIPGGDTAANVTGLVIQEIDQNRNVVFQWRSWDHFLITDAWHENLHAHNIDYVHGNAIELDNDGNLLISSRHLDEITKIDRTTGAIIWRFGGKNNQFTFLNDTLKFTYQHAIRRIANGNITLFDNGNFHTPKFSRAIEYSLNEITRTATAVWQYRHIPIIYGSAMGYVQRMPGGNTLISWGITNPTVTEVTPQGTIAFEMTLPLNMFSYRVFKFDWTGPPLSTGNEHGEEPFIFYLHQNYPNPFNPVTTIKYGLPKYGNTRLIIYDITGQVVKTLVDEFKDAGTYEVTFDASNFASGVYFYSLESGSYKETKKMLMIK